MKLINGLPLVALGFALSTTPALASGDAAAGEKVFKKCKVCHVVDAEKHKTGLHLIIIMGRSAGSGRQLGCDDERFSSIARSIQFMQNLRGVFS